MNIECHLGHFPVVFTSLFKLEDTFLKMIPGRYKGNLRSGCSIIELLFKPPIEAVVIIRVCG